MPAPRSRTRIRTRVSLCLTWLAVWAIAQSPSTAGADAAGEPAEPPRWRQSREALSDAEIEILVRGGGYRAGRGVDGEVQEPGVLSELGYQAGKMGEKVFPATPGPAPQAYQGGRNADVLSIKGDRDFRSELTRNDLELIDAVDNRSTGLQALLIRDKGPAGHVYVIFRGTEAHIGTNSERWRDVYDDLGDFGSGQYAGDRVTLTAWAAEHTGKLVVTGHSLGGALGQRFIAENPRAVTKAVFFNSAAVDEETAQMVAPNLRPPITYYVHPDDPVSKHGGESHVPGRVMMVEGGSTDSFAPGSVLLAEHRGNMLQGGTKVREADFGVWQGERRTIETAVDLIDRGYQAADGLAESARVIAGGRTQEQIEKEQITARQAAYRRALERGEIRLRPGVSEADLMEAVENRSPAAGGMSDLTERLPDAEAREVAVASKRCEAAGSEAHWDFGTNAAACRCKQGTRWNAERNACAIDREAQVAAFDCSSYGAGATAVWNEKREAPVCSCANGQMPNATKNGCVPASRDWIVAQTDCSKHENARAYWNEAAGEARCKWCKPGFAWDGPHVNCVRKNVAAAPAARPVPAARAPGTTPVAKGTGKWKHSEISSINGQVSLVIDFEAGTFTGEIEGKYEFFGASGLYHGHIRDGQYKGTPERGTLTWSGVGTYTPQMRFDLDTPGSSRRDDRPRRDKPMSLNGVLKDRTISGDLGDPKLPFQIVLD